MDGAGGWRRIGGRRAVGVAAGPAFQDGGWRRGGSDGALPSKDGRLTTACTPQLRFRFYERLCLRAEDIEFVPITPIPRPVWVAEKRV